MNVIGRNGCDETNAFELEKEKCNWKHMIKIRHERLRMITLKIIILNVNWVSK